MKYPNIFPEDFTSQKLSQDGQHPYDKGNFGSFRRYLPQFLASSAKNLLILQIGLILAFPTILIPALTAFSANANQAETLMLTPSQKSWLASTSYICQPIGSIFSGLLAEPIGRKWSMLFINVPLLIAWLMLYFADTLDVIFIAFALLGTGVGLMEAPIFTYIGEIAEPSIRGILLASAGIASTIGFFLVYTFGIFLTWRNAALMCSIFPISTIIAIYFIPETPIWYISKNRPADALRSLQWLRGWVPSSAVMNEFTSMQNYYQTTTLTCHACEKQFQICTHTLSPTIYSKLNEFSRRRTLIPFVLVALQFLVAQSCGNASMRPYIVQIVDTFKSSVNPKIVIIWLGVLGILANIILLVFVRVLGKRKIYLYSITGTFMSCFVLGIYGFLYLPIGTTSFNLEIVNTQLQLHQNSVFQYIPFICIYLLHFSTCVGVASTPNLLTSELFPFKSRALAAGLVTSINYIMAFLSTKLYYNFEIMLSFPGICIGFGFVGVIGFIVMYLIMPETEGRTLEDIEYYFSDNKRKLTNIHIPINVCEVNTSKTIAREPQQYNLVEKRP